MSVVKTTRVWDGITLNEFTDTSTGSITIKSTSGVTLASSVDNTWVIDDLTSLTRLYNNAKIGSRIQTEFTEAQVKREFFNNGIKIFNEDRASVLNNTNNYSSITESDNNRDAFFVKKIPGIVQPNTKRSITSEGGTTSINSFGTEPQTLADSSNFSVRSLGQKVKSSIDSSSLRYPLGELPDLSYDFVTFKIYDYDVKKGGLTLGIGEDRLGSPVEGKNTITLPIVGNITESNSVDWGGDSMNEIQRLGAQFAMDSIKAGGAGSLEKLGEALTKAKNSIADMAKDEKTGPAIAAYFAGQAVGANIQARATGTVLNNNLELLFNGPKLRTFNFNFKLRPRFKDESDQIREIIRAFKKNMAPSRSTGSIFLTTPNIFEIKYEFNGDQHPYMNKIKPCALQAFSVNYTPDGSYMTYGDGGLTGYDISLTFGEIEPIYADDHEDSQGMSY